MSRWISYLNTGKKIIEDYDGRTPLAAWLKDFFRQHKQMGSRDRKIISEEVYKFYRLGHSSKDVSWEEQILMGLFLCSNTSNDLLSAIKPEWNNNIHLSLQEKAIYLDAEGLHISIENIFPWSKELSDGIDKNLFNQSHLTQPDLFLRVRPHRQIKVEQKLTEAGILYTKRNDQCIALPNATKLDQVLQIDEEVVIQDFNSQRVGEFIQPITASQVDAVSLWDCCSGSGGKSIMAYDLNPGINLTVSDSRPAIIENLNTRFKRAGISDYYSFVADISTPDAFLPTEQFDHIIADVPCTGSGTWSRTPEQLYFFKPERIKYYSNLQKNILSNAIPKLKNNGRLTYITCSVFKKENEEIVDFIKENFGLQLEVMELLKGYEIKADSMFVATFKNKL